MPIPTRKKKSKPVRLSLWLEPETYRVLTTIAENWDTSRTAVVVRLILNAKETRLEVAS